MTYEPKRVKAPRLAGGALRAAAGLAGNRVTGGLLAGKMLASAGILELRGSPVVDPHPVHPPGLPPRPPRTAGVGRPIDFDAVLGPLAAEPPPGFRPETAADFAAAYRARRAGPVEVAMRVLERAKAFDALDPPMRVFIAQDEADVLAQARESAKRWAAGRPLSPLDGVPVAVKDELDQIGYPTTVGTRFLGREPAAADAGAVARLRNAGALLVGKANMHEIGLGVTGINPHHGTARNPHDPARATGGSSSGPAAAVAAGLCPVAVGADGGGSIRIPSSLCGAVGLKPTFGRVSEHGAAPLCWSVAHVGPIAATVADAALGYALMAGPDPADPNSLGHPDPTLDGIASRDLSGLRIGIFRPWFEDASPDVVECCTRALDGLVAAGAEVREIEIANLDLVRPVHLVTIVSEMAAAHLEHHAAHRSDYSPETRLNLALSRRLTAYDYVHAQRHRARICAGLARILGEVDAVATPSTACTAPVLPPRALGTGESNLELVERIMRFAPIANLAGLPAVSVPAGYDAGGLPIGIQFLGRPWEEHLLLRLAAAVERLVARKEPRVHCRLLPAA